MHTIIIVAVCALPAIAFLGFYATGGLIALAFVYWMIRDFFVERPPLVWVLASIFTLGFLAVTAIAAVGYHKRWDVSALEAYDRYVNNGTAIGRSLPASLARDPGLAPEDLLPMLNSGDEHRQTKALRILKERSSPRDLQKLGHVVVRLLPVTENASAPQWGTPRHVLEDWLEALGLGDIKTRAQLDEWLIQMDPQQQYKQTEDNQDDVAQ